MQSLVQRRLILLPSHTFRIICLEVQLSSKSTCLIMYKPWGSVSKTERKNPSTYYTEDRVERKGPGRE